MGAESPKDECGLFGVWAPGEDVARLTYFGLFAQQHRGQESAGIAVSDGHNILIYKDLGLVAQVFNEATLTTLQGDLAVGHTRYSTTGSTTWDNAQPVFKNDGVRALALGHNGNLVNTGELVSRLGHSSAATTDSDLVATMLAYEMAHHDLEGAAMRVLPELEGAFCFVMADERSVFAARDPHGLRPLALGKLPQGFVVASETCALDIVGATFIREVEPGELVRIDDRGLHSSRFARSPRAALCIFEFVYLSRADSRMKGVSVHEVAARDGPAPRRRAPGRRRPRDRGAEHRPLGRPGVLGGLGDPVRRRAAQEPVRGPDVHPAVPVAPRAGREAEAEPAAGHDPRQAPDRRRRLDRPGHDHAADRRDAPRGRRRRGPHPDHVPRRSAGHASTGST